MLALSGLIQPSPQLLVMRGWKLLNSIVAPQDPSVLVLGRVDRDLEGVAGVRAIIKHVYPDHCAEIYRFNLDLRQRTHFDV